MDDIGTLVDSNEYVRLTVDGRIIDAPWNCFDSPSEVKEYLRQGTVRLSGAKYGFVVVSKKFFDFAS